MLKTSLETIPLKGRKSAYKFYLDLEKALDGDWNDAVIGVKYSKLIQRFSEIYELVDSFLKRHIYFFNYG